MFILSEIRTIPNALLKVIMRKDESIDSFLFLSLQKQIEKQASIKLFIQHFLMNCWDLTVFPFCGKAMIRNLEMRTETEFRKTS